MPVENNQRSHRRLDVTDDEKYWIEFEYPGPGGRPFKVNLKDVSQAGLSFYLTPDLPAIEIGDPIAGAMVQLGKRRLRGELVVAHLSTAVNGEPFCGALFYPATDKDLKKLKSTVADLLAD